MEHLVKFVSAEGKDGQHVAGSLEDALSFVERLRNAEEAADVRVFRMQEVPIEFRAYYKVELRPGADVSQTAEGASEASVPAPPAVEVASAPSGVQAPIVISSDAAARTEAVEIDVPQESGKRLFSRS